MSPRPRFVALPPVRVPARLLTELEAAAQACHVSRARFVAEAIDAALATRRCVHGAPAPQEAPPPDAEADA